MLQQQQQQTMPTRRLAATSKAAAVEAEAKQELRINSTLNLVAFFCSMQQAETLRR